MVEINNNYINGAFVEASGNTFFDLISPVNNEIKGRVKLGTAEDVNAAVASAKEAFKTFSKTTKSERLAYLKAMREAVNARKQELVQVMVEEYGAPLQFCQLSAEYLVGGLDSNIQVLESFDFTKLVGSTQVQLDAVGVVGIITPWNASNGFICNKLSTAIAAGCTAVIKPSEMSAAQTQLIAECLHEAGLPKGVFNIVNGVGEVVGDAIVNHPDVSKISFTGSTAVGKYIAKCCAAGVKRYTLELGGKSPNIIMPDANLDEAIPLSVAAAYMNNGQACIAATRLLIQEDQLDEVKSLLKSTVQAMKVGVPAEADTAIGPMVSRKQYERVQEYIKAGVAEGAEILIGGEGHPEGLEQGNFVRPTVFVNVTNDMKIAQEEIFGPVLSVITYKDLDDAVNIANDTDYGLSAYIQGGNEEAAINLAKRMEAGRVVVNGFKHDPLAPFGGFKQSGVGREFGVYGLESFLEPKSLLV